MVGSDGLIHEAQAVLSLRVPPVMGAAVADPGHMTAVKMHCRAVERLVCARYGRIHRENMSALERQEVGEPDPDRPVFLGHDHAAQMSFDRHGNVETRQKT